jgi:hypothetical protein
LRGMRTTQTEQQLATAKKRRQQPAAFVKAEPRGMRCFSHFCGPEKTEGIGGRTKRSALLLKTGSAARRHMSREIENE